MASKRTKSIEELETYLFYGGFGRVVQEYRFHPVRRWRADYYLPDQEPPVIVEYDGLMNNRAYGSNVGHASISGILRDSEKLNAATAMGIRCFRANAKSIQDGSFFTLMDEVLEKIIPERRETVGE